MVVLIILFLGALFAIPFVFKDRLINLARQEINKSVNAKVDFRNVGITLLSDFPHLTFSLQDLSVINHTPFEGDTLAYVGSFSFSINLMSLLKQGPIDIRSIRIDRPLAHIKILPDGTANYDIFKSDNTSQGKQSASPASYSVKLKSFAINRGELSYTDRQGDMEARLADLNFRGKGDFTQDLFDFQTLLSISQATLKLAGIKYLNNANIELKMNLGVDLPNKTYTLKDNTLRVNALVLGMEGWVSDRTPGQYGMDVKFSARETSFKNILSLVPAIYLKDFEKVKTEGRLSLNGYAKGTWREESFPAFALQMKVEDASFQYPDLPAAVTDIQMDFKAENPGGDLDNTVIHIPKFSLKAGGEPLELRILVKTPVSDPDMDIQAKGKLNLTNVKQFYPLQEGEEIAGLLEANAAFKGRLSYLEKEQYEKIQADGKVNINGLKYKSPSLPAGVAVDKTLLGFATKGSNVSSAGLPVNAYATLDIQNLTYADNTLPGGRLHLSGLHLIVNQNDVTLQHLKAQIGKTDAELTGRLDNLLAYLLSDGTLTGQLNLKSSLIDLNEWMDATASADSEAASPAQTESSAALIPNNVAIDLGLAVARMVFDKAELYNTSGRATVKDQVLTLQSLSTSGMGGTLDVKGYLDAKNPTNTLVNFSYNLKDLDIAKTVSSLELAAKLAPVFTYMNGRFSSQMYMSGALLEDLSLQIPSVSGKGRVDIKNAVISGFPALVRIADQLQLQQLKNLRISDAWTVFEIRNGRVEIEPFDVAINAIKLHNYGSYGLDNTIDFNSVIDVPTEMLGAASGFINDLLAKNPLSGIGPGNLPQVMKFRVRITETLTNPKVQISIAGKGEGSVKEQIREEVKETIREVKEQVSTKAREEAEKIMQEARQQAQKVKDAAQKLADQVRREGYAQAKKLEDEAKNPLAKTVAQAAAKKLRKETDDKADKIIREANDQANRILENAQKRADQLLQSKP